MPTKDRTTSSIGCLSPTKDENSTGNSTNMRECRRGIQEKASGSRNEDSRTHAGISSSKGLRVGLGTEREGKAKGAIKLTARPKGTTSNVRTTHYHRPTDLGGPITNNNKEHRVMGDSQINTANSNKDHGAMGDSRITTAKSSKDRRATGGSRITTASSTKGISTNKGNTADLNASVTTTASNTPPRSGNS